MTQELPPEGDEAEAQGLAQRPLRLPTYRLERIHVAILNVDYSPPHGSGYARPLSQGRLRNLRREWDPLAVSPLTVSRRPDNTLWVIDGNHRRFVAFEKGMLQLPAMVHSGLTREQEADLYTKLGTVLGQTPWTRFQARLVAGDDDARAIVRIAQRHGLEVNGSYSNTDSKVQAVARVEWIYARGGEEGLNWTLSTLVEAFGGFRASLDELALEGVFGFYVRYGDRIQRSEVVRLLSGAGFNAWEDRAGSIWTRVDVGRRSNTFGMAIADMVNEEWRRQGKKIKELLPAWEMQIGQFGSRFRPAPFPGLHTAWTSSSDRNPAPQQLPAS